jgi:hypothetical protein
LYAGFPGARFRDARIADIDARMHSADMTDTSLTYLPLAFVLVLLARINWLARVKYGDVERLYSAYGFACVGLSVVAVALHPLLSSLRDEPATALVRAGWVIAALGAAFFARRGAAMFPFPLTPWRSFMGVLSVGLLSVSLLALNSVLQSRSWSLWGGMGTLVHSLGSILGIIAGTASLGLMALGHWRAAAMGDLGPGVSRQEHRLLAAGFLIGVIAVWVELGLEHWWSLGDTKGVLVLALWMVAGFGLMTVDVGNVQSAEVRMSENERRLEETEELLRGQTTALREALVGATSTLATVAAERDPYTATHQERMACLAVRIAEELYPDDPELIEGIQITARLHDIGKLSIPYAILNKSGPLDPLQRELVRGHATAGAKILAGLNLRWPVEEWVLQHHERLDGSGYPNGIEGEQISMGARILAVADVMEAMCSHRPHRPAPGLEAALDEIAMGAGSRYDQRVVDACLELFEKKRYRLPENGDGDCGAFLAPGASSALQSGYWLRANAGA